MLTAAEFTMIAEAESEEKKRLLCEIHDISSTRA